MGDTYDKVQDRIAVADSKEIIDMLLEIEQVMWWRLSRNESQYLHICNDFGEKMEDKILGWEGRIRSIKQVIVKIEKKVRENKQNTENFLDYMIEIVYANNDSIKNLEEMIKRDVGNFRADVIRPMQSGNNLN